MQRLQREMGLTYLFISHDMSVVRHVANRVAVMYLGKLMEILRPADLYVNPLHPYTMALLSAVPIPDPRIERQRRTHHPQRRPAQPDQHPQGMPLPYALPDCPEYLSRGRAAIGR